MRQRTGLGGQRPLSRQQPCFLNLLPHCNLTLGPHFETRGKVAHCAQA